jgi:hypothetical protein
MVATTDELPRPRRDAADYSGVVSEPGEQRPSSWSGWQRQASRVGRAAGGRSLGSALLQATVAALLSAAAWAVLRGILELGVTGLAALALGGWIMGSVLRGARSPRLLAAAWAASAWLLGLILSWLLAMALLPGSTKSFAERLAGTPFVDWLAPKFGALELAGLVVCIGAAAYAAGPRGRA